MQMMRQNVRYGMRLIRQSPGFAAITVLILALGIGANTAIFGVLDALVLRNLPVWRPDQLVQVAPIYRNGAKVPLSFPVFQQLQENQRVFSSFFGWSPGLNYNVEVDSTLFQSSVRGVTGNYYGTLGARPLLGRLIGPEDARTPGEPVAVLGYEFWSRRFGRDQAVMGKAIRIEGTSFTIVGVSRKWFMGMTPGTPPDITIPITAGPFATQITQHALLWIFAAGRRNNGVTIQQAGDQLRSFWHDTLVATAPTTAPGPRLQSWLAMGVETKSAATGVNADLREHFERPLHVLMLLAGLILLVACVNLANLTLARVTARGREMGVRVALGATRWQIVRQLLTETILLSAAGAVIAFVFATWGGHLLLTMISGGGRGAPVILDLRPDWRLFALTALAAIGTGVLIALAPVWQTARQNPVRVLRSDERTLASSGGGLSRCLIVMQIALSLVLVFGAGLLLQTFETLRSLDTHFQRETVLQVALNPRPEGLNNVDINSYRKQLQDDVGNLPGVASASFGGLEIPAGDNGWKDTVSAASADAPGDAGRLATLLTVSPGFFQTLGIPILSGRDFDWSDDEKHPRVAIVDNNLARQLPLSGGLLGRRVRFGVRPELQDLQIIGIASSACVIDLRHANEPVIYIPSPQHPDRSDAGHLFVRSQNPAAVTRAVQNEIQSHGHEYSTGAKTLEETSAETLSEDRATAVMSSLFAGLALLLAGIGLFGLMSYAVTRRTREIGIRMAVGAQPGSILGLILRESVLLSVIGVVIGVPFAIAAKRLIAHMLFGVTPGDPLTFAVAAAALLAVGAGAGYWPARRAAKIDPMTAMRCE